MREIAIIQLAMSALAAVNSAGVVMGVNDGMVFTERCEGCQEGASKKRAKSPPMSVDQSVM